MSDNTMLNQNDFPKKTDNSVNSNCVHETVSSNCVHETGDQANVKQAVSVQTVLDTLEQIAPKEMAEAWDAIGLQVGDPQDIVSHVLICLDANARTVKRAADEGYQLLLTHHPLIFSPLPAVRADLAVQKHVYQLIRHRLALISAHTNLDAAEGGVADSFADAICQALQPLFNQAALTKTDHSEMNTISQIKPSVHDVDPASESKTNDFNASQTDAGPITKLEAPGPFTRLLLLKQPLMLASVYQAVHKYTQAAGSRLNTDDNHPVRRIAIWPGSLSEDIIPQLSADKTDLIICGECKYHLGLEMADNGLTVMDIGHDISERVALRPLQQKMEQLLPQLVFAVDPGFDYNKVAY